MPGHRIVRCFRRISIIDSVDNRPTVRRSRIHNIAVIKHCKHKAVPCEQTAPVTARVFRFNDRQFNLFSRFVSRYFHSIVIDCPPAFRSEINRGTVLCPQFRLLILCTICTAADIHTLSLRECDCHLAAREPDIHAAVHPLPACCVI